jgi:hypothetical protein
LAYVVALSVLFATVLFATVFFAAVLLPQQANAESITLRFPLPAAPLDIEVENSSRVWFTLPAINAIGSLEVDSTSPVLRYTYTAYTLPSPNSEPYRLSVANGDVWFTQRSGNRIGRLSILDGTIAEYAVPTTNSRPTGIDVAPDGSVWFAQSNSNKMAVLTPANGAISEYDTGRTATDLDLIDARSPAIVWATAPGNNLLFGFRRASNDVVEIALEDYSGAQGSVRGLAATPAGVPWITTQNVAKIGSYLYGTLAIWLWSRFSPETADLVDILLSTEGTQTYLWGLDASGRSIVQVELATMRIIQQAGVGRESSVLTSLSLDTTNSTVWVADAGESALYALRAPYELQFYLPVVAR